MGETKARSGGTIAWSGRVLLALFITVLFSWPATGAIKRFTDEQGNLHITTEEKTEGPKAPPAAAPPSPTAPPSPAAPPRPGRRGTRAFPGPGQAPPPPPAVKPPMPAPAPAPSPSASPAPPSPPPGAPPPAPPPTVAPPPAAPPPAVAPRPAPAPQPPPPPEPEAEESPPEEPEPPEPEEEAPETPPGAGSRLPDIAPPAVAATAAFPAFQQEDSLDCPPYRPDFVVITRVKGSRDHPEKRKPSRDNSRPERRGGSGLNRAGGVNISWGFGLKEVNR